MKTILVTGGCGFIGSSFISYCVDKYPEITFINLDIITYCASLNNVKDIADKSNYSFERCNLTDFERLIEILNKYSVDGVIHFAAQTHVDDSFKESLQFTRDNVLGTHTLLEACRIYGFNKIERFVHVSTDEVYGESLNDDIGHEASVLNPTNPYSASKASAEQLIHAYKKSYNLKAIITRGNNVYGPRQYPDKLISRACLSLIQGKKIPIHGNGKQKRNYVYIDDVVRAYELILFEGKVGNIYNIAGDHEYEVLEIIKELVSISGRDLEDSIVYTNDRPFNDRRYLVDGSSLKNLGWKQEVTSFRDGLIKTYNWYTTHDLSYWENRNRKYLIWGGRGWIGSQFIDYMTKTFPNVSFILARTRLGQDVEEVRKELVEFMYQIDGVICMTGRTSGPTNPTIDYLEDKEMLPVNIGDNLFSPVSLALLCKELNLYFVYLGTGCIFKYDETHPPNKFTSEDIPNYFGSGYSVVKGFTDRLMHQLPVLNVRIRMPISAQAHSRDFITKIVNYKKVIDVPNSVTVLPTIFPVLAKLIESKKTGTVNMTNPGVISHVEILNMYKKYIDPNHNIQVFSQEEQRKILKADRSNNELQPFDPTMPSAREAVEEIIKNRSLV